MKILFGGRLAFCASMVVGLPTSPDLSNERTTSEATSAVAVVAMDGCRRCEESDDQPIIHAFLGAGVWYEGTNPHTAWVAGHCSDPHDVCNTEPCDPECLAEVASATTAGDVATLEKLLSKFPALEYNANRRAIQIVDCDNHPFMHYALGGAIAEDLGHRLAENERTRTS